jgi:hypothetical protein
MHRELAAYQDAFSAALLADDPAADAPPDVARLVAQPGFAVYRNTVRKACIDALQANYPTVARLVGDEWFRAAAAVHARRHLPPQPSLLMYGEQFPAFLASFEPACEVPYLAAVARIDRWWTESHAASDGPLLDPAALAALAPEQMRRIGMRPHAAARWGWCDEWPAFTLWQRNRAAAVDDAGEVAWEGEGVLLTRPLGAVQVEPLGRAGVALLDASAAGQSVEQAVLVALDADRDADISALIHRLLDAGAFSALQASSAKELPA